MKLNVKKALDAEEERKNKPKPLPRIKTASPRPSPAERVTEVYSEKPVIEITVNTEEASASLLEMQIRALRVQRAKLSNQIGPLINEVAEQLKKEGGQALADEFLNGNMAMPEIKEHYAKIQKVQEEIMRLVDGGANVKGETANVMQEESHEVSGVKYEIRRLDDFIYKKQKNLEKARGGIKQPKNSDRVNRWRTEIAMAEARRTDLKIKLKNLRHG